VISKSEETTMTGQVASKGTEVDSSQDFAHAIDLLGVHDSPPRRSLVGPLLIAGQDAEYMRGALCVAEILARRDRVNAHVLGAVPPLALPRLLLVNLDHEALEDGRRERHLDRLRRRLHQVTGISTHFSVEAITGSPAVELARAARERGSEYILVGLEQYDALGRAATEDVALQVRGSASIPVLAVPMGQERLPQRALIAVDFSAASMRAARAAIPLLAPRATLTLVHVEPTVDFQELGMDGWAENYERGVAMLFEPLVALLTAASDITVKAVVLHSNGGDDTAEALLEHARQHDFDLIATGTQAHTALDRHLTGSVSTALLRGAQCAVLMSPSK
jgi:nucleotide-binding universal stress UspA family protein